MKIEQLDLFSIIEPEAPKRELPPARPAPLNGMYYERATDMFVGYTQGKRLQAIAAKHCGWPKDWQEKTKRERAI
ncbi:hypothetical protein PV433_10510 [Paenibacillus sp. GYB004]|uniref:hypothetical protein n=1 Tax=Paenibacillus sp. GYB004 TaxID=2994393 RepID=UPI002F966F61